MDCEAVSTGRYGRALGVPVAVWGLAGYLVMLGAIGSRLLLPLAAFASLVSLTLAGISTFAIRVLCPLCVGTWVVNGGLLFLAWRRHSEAAEPDRKQLAAGAVPALILIGTAWAYHPPLASLDGWRGGFSLERGMDDDGHYWIGAREPSLTIEEYLDYKCGHCKQAHSRLRYYAQQHPHEIRLVRHDYARMPCELVPGAKNPQPCNLVRLAMCAGDQGKFWETSDYLFTHQGRWETDRIAEALDLDLEKLRGCIDKDDTFARAHAEYEHARRKHIVGTPGFVIDDKRVDLKEVVERIEAL